MLFCPAPRGESLEWPREKLDAFERNLAIQDSSQEAFPSSVPVEPRPDQTRLKRHTYSKRRVVAVSGIAGQCRHLLGHTVTKHVVPGVGRRILTT